MTRTAVPITSGVRKAKRIPLSVRRRPGDPAHRPARQIRLTKNEREYADACVQAWNDLSPEVIREQFVDPTSKELANLIDQSITSVQTFLGELTLYQVEQSGRQTFDDIRNAVAAEWKRVEKAVTPSEFAGSMQFNRASPNATRYASLSAANMLTDMVDSQIVAVRSVIESAFKDGLTRVQTSNRLVELLNEMPARTSAQRGLAGAASIFGEATKGLNQRYAKAVYNRANRLMRDNPNMSATQLRKKVNTYGKKLQKSRARMIARTEIMRASNQGRLEGMFQAAERGLINPVLAKKQWVTSSFDVCEICVPLSGVAIGLKESFGAHLPDGGLAPPAHPNCRCRIREIPDPASYGTPISVGTGRPDAPLRFIRPKRPGARLQQLEPGQAPAQPLVGQPGAPPMIGDDIADLGLPPEVRARPVSAIGEEGSLDLAGKVYRDALDEGSEAATEALIRHKGYDAPPRVVSAEELGRFVNESPAGEMRRQVGPGRRRNLATDRLEEIPPNEIAEEFRTGKYFVGEGMHGRGSYVIEGTADEAAEYLAGRQATRGPHEVMEMTMDKDARIYDMPKELRHKSRPFGDELHDRVGSDDSHDVLIALGYDAVRYPQNITVILNRGKVIIGRSRNAQVNDIAAFIGRSVDEFPDRIPASALVDPEGKVVEWGDASNAEHWKRNVRHVKLKEAKESGLYQAIEEAGEVGMPVDVWVNADGTWSFRGGHHRIVVAEDLGLDVRVMWRGPGYTRATGNNFSIDLDEMQELKEKFPQGNFRQIFNLEPEPVVERVGNMKEQFIYNTSSARGKEVITPILEAMDEVGIVAAPLLKTGERATRIRLRNKPPKDDFNTAGTFNSRKFRPEPRYKAPSSSNVDWDDPRSVAAFRDRQAKAQRDYEQRYREWLEEPTQSEISIFQQPADEIVNAESQQITFMHELGHRLDVDETLLDVVPAPQNLRNLKDPSNSHAFFTRENERAVRAWAGEGVDPDLIDPMELPEELRAMWTLNRALRNSAAVQDLKRNIKRNVKDKAVAESFEAYALSIHELWARAFAQWFTLNGGKGVVSTATRLELGKDIIKSNRRYTGLQWEYNTDEWDYEIVPAIEAVLKQRGIIS